MSGFILVGYYAALILMVVGFTGAALALFLFVAARHRLSVRAAK
jgi:hypothetical protein